MKLTKEQKLHSDKKLKNRYEIKRLLGEGCFGSIYEAINLANKKEVALKIQFINQCSEHERKRVSLTNQIFILDKLKSVEGVPKIYQAGRWSYGVFIEIQLFQSSLHDERHHNYTETEIYKIAIQLIQILKRIHSKNVIHQDLKPQNIMRKKDGSLVIIDFGLSSFLSEEKNQYKKRGFIGTPRYASCAAHKGECQKPKDDIESLLYVLAVAYCKQAPWFEMKGPIQQKILKILKIKQAYSEKWFKKCGNAFLASYQYIKSLQNNEQVDYGYLINLFQAHRRSQIVKTLKFQNPIHKQARRKSGGDVEKYFMQVPIINLHLIDVNKSKYDKNRKKSINFSQSTQGINNSCANYSQLAQDGHIQILHALTDKILSIFQRADQILAEENIQTNSINEKEPQIFTITKLEGLKFKNPFEY